MLISDCPLCASQHLSQFLHRSRVPVHQNLLLGDRQEARNIACGELSMVVCGDCGFVTNSAFDQDLLMYGRNYDNNQGWSPSFQRHVDSLVELLVVHKGIRNKRIVEVGCGQGQFLRRIVNEGSNSGVGFDPSYSGPESMAGGRIRFKASYYDATCTDEPADVVICRHVIEHVPDPIKLLTSVRAAIVDQPQAKVFFETPCVDWILTKNVVWDFFYEHCSLFSSSSLATAFQLSGFKIESVTKLFGDQYLWLEASPAVSIVEKNGSETFKLAAAYARQEQKLVKGWKQRIEALTRKGRVALWGAGAKGATFASLIDPDCKLIDCLVDLNPNKQGKFIAGSGHEIVEPQALSERGITQAILMNPNYRQENEQIVRNEKLAVELID